MLRIIPEMRSSAVVQTQLRRFSCHDSSALLAQLREALTQTRYNPVAIGNYCRNADKFLCHLAQRKIALEAVTPDDVSSYLRLAVRQFRKRHGHPLRLAGRPSLERESTFCCGLR